MKLIKQAFMDKKIVDVNGYGFVINPLTEQIPFTSSALLKEASVELAKQVPKETTKLVTEEDKGAILVAGVSLEMGLPFGMARWSPNGLNDQIKEKLEMEYVKGEIYLSGIQKDDKVTIVDDMISTGGTLIALIKAVERTGASIVKVVCVCEKVNYNGREKVYKETGIKVESLIQIDISENKTKIVGELK
jgi:adenine/guanine phosphoribosyltransferase-like PRPP-binding protein